jgi:hypothetical protein
LKRPIRAIRLLLAYLNGDELAFYRLIDDTDRRELVSLCVALGELAAQLDSKGRNLRSILADLEAVYENEGAPV